MREEMKINYKLLLSVLQIIPLCCLMWIIDGLNTTVICSILMVGYILMLIICMKLLKKETQSEENEQKNDKANSEAEGNMPLKDTEEQFNSNQNYMYHEGQENRSKFVVESSPVHREMPKKVLIVDDSISHLKLMSSFLKKMNIDASMAQSGNEAIAAVQREKFALILMDHMMKGKDGIETVKEIRQLNGAYYKEVPIVDVLSRGMERYEVKVNTDYYQACLAKPIEYELLLQVMITYGLYELEDAVS